MVKRTVKSDEDYRLNLRLSRSNPQDEALIAYIEGRPMGQSKVDRIRELYQLGMTAPVSPVELAEFKRIYKKLSQSSITNLEDELNVSEASDVDGQPVRQNVPKMNYTKSESSVGKELNNSESKSTISVKDPVLIDPKVDKDTSKVTEAPKVNKPKNLGVPAGLFSQGLVVESDD